MDKTFTFKDIFKKGFWENFTVATGELTFTRIVVTLALTFLIGMLIFFIYRRTYRGVLYNRAFNVSLVVISLVSALVIMIISSNIVLSLGMVGALSIVRFRTAVKDPLDTVFMFWAITAGIAMGAGGDFYWAGIIGSAAIAVVIVLMSLGRTKNGGGFLLVVRYAAFAEERVRAAADALPRRRLKAKTASADGVELTLEVRLTDRGAGVTEQFMAIEGVRDVSLVAPFEHS